MSGDKTIFVLCENARKFEDFKKESQMSGTHYISGVESITGIKDIVILCYGNSRWRKDFLEIYRYAKNNNIEMRSYGGSTQNN